MVKYGEVGRELFTTAYNESGFCHCCSDVQNDCSAQNRVHIPKPIGVRVIVEVKDKVADKERNRLTEIGCHICGEKVANGEVEC